MCNELCAVCMKACGFILSVKELNVVTSAKCDVQIKNCELCVQESIKIVVNSAYKKVYTKL